MTGGRGEAAKDVERLVLRHEVAGLLRRIYVFFVHEIGTGRGHVFRGDAASDGGG